MTNSLASLVSKYGDPKRVTCQLPMLKFPPVNENRHGEVCMAILRPNGRFLLQTKQSYPNSIMRLPTGGIKESEDIEHALFREIWEETNLEVDVERFVATLRYNDGKTKSGFQTHMFFCLEIKGDLQVNDPKERISAWAEAKPDELRGYAEELRQITPSWNSWGHFRAAALDELAEFCTREKV